MGNWTASELASLPTLDDVNGDELKVSDDDRRVWLGADGRTVTVEELTTDVASGESGPHAVNVTDRWRVAETYDGSA